MRARAVPYDWQSHGLIAYRLLLSYGVSRVRVAFTKILAFDLRRSVMKVCRAGKGVVAVVGVASLALVWSQTAHAQVKLEHKFPEGKKLTYKTSSKTRQVLTLMGMEIETEQNSTSISSQTNGKRRSDSNLPIEKKTDSLRVELSLPGGMNETFDSTDPNAKFNNDALAFLGDVFKLASEIVYTVVLDDHNKVKAIEGTEKLLEKADKLDPMARDLIRDQVETDKLKRDFEQGLQSLPDVLARPGEPWERTELLEIGGGQTLSFRKKYEYLGTEKKGDKTLDKISSKAIEVSYKQDPDSKSPLKVVKSNLKIDSSEGTILFDREEGHVTSSKGMVRIKGDMTFSANGVELPGKLDLKIETNVELQPAAK
jgi:hypothetical protein